MMTTSTVQVITNIAAPAGIAASVFSNVHTVGAAWMLSSALFTTYSTTKFLRYSPPVKLDKVKYVPLSRAALLTLFRFGGSLALGLLLHPNFEIMNRIAETWKILPTFAIPALFLFIANYANSISLTRIGISLTYTSKCAIPLITLILTVLLDGIQALPPLPVLLSLLPIGLGIAAASWSHPHFELVGFLAALTSCASQSALNVTTQRIMKRMNVAGPLAQRAMVTVGLVIASSMSLYQIISRSNPDRKELEARPPGWLTAMAVSAYHVEYVLSFMFVKMVAPITYSATDAVRRLAIILAGQYMFGGPAFTRLNIFGIAMALGGAVTYSVLNQ
jgi:Triose-phosphate Transporter family